MRTSRPPSSAGRWPGSARAAVACLAIAAALGQGSRGGAGEPQKQATGDEASGIEAVKQAFGPLLDRNITLELREASVETVRQSLIPAVNVPVFVEPEVARNAVPITFPKMTLPYTSLLRWVCRFWSCTCIPSEGAILLLKAGSAAVPVSRSYDIGDLPSGSIAGTGQRFPDLAEELAEEQNRAAAGVGWVAFVRETVEPGTWRRAGTAAEAPLWAPYVARYRDGKLIVSHTAWTHRKVEAALNNVRRARSLQVHIQARYLRVGRAPWAELKAEVGIQRPADEAKAAPAGIEPSCTRISNEQVEAILKAVLKRHKGSLLTAPRLTCYNTQRASFRVIAGPSDVRPVNPDREPEIGGIPEGASFAGQPFVSSDRRSITLVLSGPASGRARNWGERRRFVTTVTVPDGGSVLLDGLAQFDEPPPGIEKDGVLILLVTAQVVPDIFEE